jgi:hypothetical protein
MREKAKQLPRTRPITWKVLAFLLRQWPFFQSLRHKNVLYVYARVRAPDGNRLGFLVVLYFNVHIWQNQKRTKLGE